MQVHSHGAKQRSPSLRVALEPHANFKIDVSVAADRGYASKPIADLAKVSECAITRERLTSGLNSLEEFQRRLKPFDQLHVWHRGWELIQGRALTMCSKAMRSGPSPDWR